LSSVRAGDDATTLVVPIDVVGLCVGEDDYQQATNGFAGATAAYDDQATSTHPAFLGFNVARGFDFDPWDQLEVGVHLHWALPDGLTRGGGPGAELDFPPTPTRWLVTRVAISGDTVTTRSWLIQSDALSAQQPVTGSSVTLPVKSSQFAAGFAYLGQSHELGDEGWSEERAVNGPALADAAGRPLNAVSNGEVGFAAYYPSCRGVFGFWDPLDDLDPPKASPAQLTYSVHGWYDDPTHDPVQAGTTPAQLQAARGWTFAPGTPAPSRSVYSGVFEGIAWSSQIDYVFGQNVQKALPAEVAIGNTSAEALAAHFMAKDHPDVPLFETLLDAFQSGLLEVFKQPSANSLTELEERLHDQRYAGVRSGKVFSIVSPKDTSPNPSELIDLPAPLADDLNELNVLRQQADQCAFHADWFRWQLFADWYRIFMIDPNERSAAYALAQQRYGAWDTLQQKRDALYKAAHAQYEKVEAELPPEMLLRGAPATRFVQPSDPAVLITGDAVDFPARYGGDGRFDPDGYLVCRTDGQLLTGVAVGDAELQANDLTAVTAPAGLPDQTLLTALLRESCLLSTVLLANMSGETAGALQTALGLALEGKPQDVYTLTGQLPSPVGVNWWYPDQWLPLFASWTVEYLPLQPTKSGTTPETYGATVINANFRLDQNAGGTFTYAPTGGSGSIEIDPSTATFSQQYTGAGNLTPKPAETLAGLLTNYLKTHTDSTLSTVLGELTSGAGFLVAPLNGLSEALTMRQQSIQLQVQVPPKSQYAALTEVIAPIVGDTNRSGGPDFASDFNPLRAGYLKLSLQLVDAFGQKRDVTFPELACAKSMTTVVKGTTVPSVAYLPPRIAQPSRLSFHWLAADGSGLEEMTGNPATSPVCGWLLPNHLDGSLAIYDQLGRPLGTLFLEHGGGDSPIGWQSAPGDARTIDQDLETVMAYQNQHLRDVAVAIGGPDATADNFTALWKVLDTVGQTIEPGPLPTDSDLAVLVGRPIALVEAALRLELRGTAMLDLGWDVVGNDTDAGLTGIEFPVVLGNLAKLRDGLIGYYKETAPGAGYDFTSFYSQGADPAAKSGVVQPAQDTLCVTPSPPLDPNGANEPPDLAPVTQKVLMLMDPRAQVHATTGTLPTASLTLPSHASQATMSALDLSFFTAPVLRGAGALSIPTPIESGYALSFIDQQHDDRGALEWVVTPEITTPTADAVWAYTPQQVDEGWLRLNPIVLGFELTDASGKPVVQAGQPNSLTLTVTNRARRAVTFRHGAPVAEGSAPAGSVFYVHFGPLVAQSAVGQIALSATGWTFECFSSSQYGAYWAAAPAADVELAAGAALSIAVGHLVPSPPGAQAQVAFDYYAIDGIDDGVSVDVLAVQAKQTERRTP
jgi:hypothetical protein